jgi:ribosomal protein S18 acetylase RimI-like enzyme
MAPSKDAEVRIREMRPGDYPAVITVWRRSEGLSLTVDDERPGIALYLRRNRGLCFVATLGRTVVGTVLCGHDGRRAILRHLAVLREHRRRGIGRRLVGAVLSALATERIRKCNLFVLDDNADGLRYWKSLGFRLLDDSFRTLQAPVPSTRRRKA